MNNTRIIILILVGIMVAGCSTTVSTIAGHGNGGIPYYLPKAVLHVREPIEIKRTEELYAIVQMGGMSQYLYPMRSELDKAIGDLRRLGNVEDQDIKFVPLPKEFTFPSESKTETDESVKVSTGQHESKDEKKINNSTEKLTAVTSNQSTNTHSYKPSDADKAYEVLLIPDFNKPYELFIENTGLTSSDVNLTITDGWKLSSIGVKSDSTATLTALTNLAGTIIGSQKEIKVAEISKSQQLELEELKQQGAVGDAGSAQSTGDSTVEFTYTIVGYTRKVSISTLVPGIYSLDKPESLSLKVDDSVIWQPISF